MKASHQQVMDFLRRGGTAVQLSGNKFVDVSLWVSAGVYDSFRVRGKTVGEMVEAGLLVQEEEYVGDGTAADTYYRLKPESVFVVTADLDGEGEVIAVLKHEPGEEEMRKLLLDRVRAGYGEEAPDEAFLRAEAAGYKNLMSFEKEVLP